MRPHPGGPRMTRARVPLARALSKLGFASRSDAIALILAGRVHVNGTRVLEPGARVAPDTIQVTIDDAPQKRAEARRVILFNKPRGVVTTRRDPEGRRTVFDVLGDAGRGLVAAGRLDRASTGLLVLTNDTRLANWLTDPANRIVRRYVVVVRGRVTHDAAAALRSSAAAIRVRKASSRETHLIVELTEGKNREIRKMFESIRHEVTRLHRVSFGEYQLGDLPSGAFREIETE
jgi:23S rRNA pseudouridine2605 synthase